MIYYWNISSKIFFRFTGGDLLLIYTHCDKHRTLLLDIITQRMKIIGIHIITCLELEVISWAIKCIVTVIDVPCSDCKNLISMIQDLEIWSNFSNRRNWVSWRIDLHRYQDSNIFSYELALHWLFFFPFDFLNYFKFE